MSEFIEIIGGHVLRGEVQISGAKNAALPLLISSLLSTETCEFTNIPNLEDINITLHLLESLGAVVERGVSRVKLTVPTVVSSEASYSLVKAMRASFWVLGPLLARVRQAAVALPGGDAIGARPVDMHLAGLERMGAQIKVKHGVVYASAPRGLHPASIELRFPSVGATHQIMMAAALTSGTTTISGAAREPEIVALAQMLSDMGAIIEGAGEETVRITGRSELGGARVRVIGDRIEAGTFLLAAAATKGSVKASGFSPQYFGKFLELLSELGLQVEVEADSVKVEYRKVLKPANLRCAPFPEIATDLQAPLMALLSSIEGSSSIEESVFEGRFGHVSELSRMGAMITIDGRSATITGVPRLSGAPVDCLDIRAGAALVIAALGADGQSELHEIGHLRRGYEALESKLKRLGAKVALRRSDAEDFLAVGC